jgi:hypothetical protein
VAYSFVVPLFIWDFSVLRRIHPVTLWGGVWSVVSLPVRLWLSESMAWLTLTKWPVDLVRR